MGQYRVDTFFDEMCAEGRIMVNQTLRAMVAKADPDLLTKIEASGGGALWEPLLFAWFYNERPIVPLAQLAFGYLDEDHKPERLLVWADGNGVVSLPGIGCMTTSVTNRMLQLDWQDGKGSLSDDGSVVAFALQTLETVPGTSIKLYPHHHPLFQKLFRGLEEDDPVSVAEPTARLKGSLAKAMTIIKQVNQRHFDELNRECVRAVILENERINSMASLHIHGSVFFSTRAENDEVFFAEDIIHQGGHVNLNAITAEATKVFTIPPGTQVCVFTGMEDDKRTFSSAFHGNFTLTRMVQFFDECLTQNIFSGKQKHELIGRFALAWDRFQYGLEVIDDRRLYTEDGYHIHQQLMATFQEIYPRRHDLLAAQDLSNQPYVFEYAKYRELNSVDACSV